MGDESDSAKKIDAGQATPLVNTPPAIDPEKILIDLQLWDGRNSTRLARSLERFADNLIDKRGLTGRYAGIDAYQAMLCAIFENDRGCVDRKPEFSTPTHWLFWLISRCVDDFGRHPEPPLGDNTADLPNDDDIEAQVDAQLRLEELEGAICGSEFVELINVIDFSDDRETLAEMMGMDKDGLNRLINRFKYFVKKFRS